MLNSNLISTMTSGEDVSNVGIDGTVKRRKLRVEPEKKEEEVEEDVSGETEKYYEKAGKEHRQELGQFYTPPTVIRNMLSTVNVAKNAKVLEPTYGSGEFLKVLLEDGYTNITGVEFDKLVFDEFKEKWESKGVKVINDDYLMHSFSEKFDLVIGNPPYFVMGKSKYPSSDYESKLKSGFGEALGGKKNIYVLATVKAIKDLKDGGVLSFLIPTSLLTSPDFQVQRDWIHKNSSIERIEVVKNRKLFHMANVEVMIFQVRKGASSNDFIKIKNGKVMFSDKKENVTEKEGVGRLSDKCEFKTGLIDVSKVPKDSLTDDSNDLPIIYGENIVGGKLSFGKKLKGVRKQYVKRGVKKSVTGPFLVVNRTVGTGNKLNVAYVETGEYVPENHTYFAKCKSSQDMKDIYDMLSDSTYIKPILEETYGQVKSITSSLLNSIPLKE